MRNVVYESECVLCNPISRDQLEKEVDLLRKGQASLYVGETSKSIYERGGKHHTDMLRVVKEVHIWSY